jgi:hypothetical protein
MFFAGILYSSASDLDSPRDNQYLAVQRNKKPAKGGLFSNRMKPRNAQVFMSAGSLPPFAASLVITCLCSQIFILAESFMSPS